MTTTLRHLGFALCLSSSVLVLLANVSVVAADGPVSLPAPEPTVAAMLPAGVMRGTSAEVMLSGNNLVPANGVRVTGEGVVAALVPLAEGRKPNPRQLAVHLTAAADAKPGVRELRVVTPGGTSNVVRFMVGAIAESIEVEPNETAAEATRIDQLPSVVNGVLDRGEDRDCHRFTAKAGQQIVLDLVGQRLHPYVSNQRPGWLEGLLTVREATDIGMAADEFRITEKSANEKLAASKAAKDAVTSRQSEVKKANDEKASAEKSAAVTSTAAKNAASQLAAAVSEANTATAQQTAATKIADEKAGIAQASADVAKTEQAKADVANKEKAAADQVAADRAAVAKATADRASALRAAAELLAFAADQAAAEKDLADKTVAAKAAADGMAAAEEAVKGAAVEQVDAKKAALDAAVAAVAKAAADQTAAEKILADMTLIAGAASQKIASAEATAKQASDEQAKADQVATEKGALAKTANELAAAARRTADQAANDRAAAEKKAAECTAAVKAAEDKVAALKAVSDQAAAEQVAAARLVADRTAAVAASNERLVAAQASAKQVAEEVNAANAILAAKKAVRDQLAEQSFRHLAYAQDFPGREDPLLVFTAPKDGHYVVEVRDDLYRGRPEFNYRLAIGELPYVTSAFPAGGRRGSPVSVSLDGFHLGDQKTLSFNLATDAPVGQKLERIANGTSNDITLQVGDDPEIIEVEPNDAVDQATASALPAVLNGIIERDGDVDCYRFTAAKGQRLILETVVSSIGSPLDPRLELLDAKGRRIKENDDTNNLSDAVLDHTFTADGEYLVRITDATGYGSRRHVYRLGVRPPRPDFSLTVSPDNPRVAAGGSVPLRVRVQRRDGFTGDIELAVSNAPAGAVVSPAVLLNGQSEHTISVTMPADAAPSVVSLSMVGKTRIGDQEVVRQAVPAEQIRYVNDWRYVAVNDLVLSVIPTAPVTLAWGAPELKLTAGETVTVPLRVQRAAGFSAPVRVMLDGLPSRVSAPPVTIEENASEAVVEIRSTNGAPATVTNVVASGTITANGSSFVQNSPALRLQVDAPAKK